MSQAVQLRRVFRAVNGGTPTSGPENWDGEIRWATPVDLANVHGGVLDHTARTLTVSGLRSGSAIVPPGSLVVSIRAPIGYVATVEHPTAFNQGCRGLVPRAQLDLRYFRYQLVALRSFLESRGQGSTFVELSSDALMATPIVNPPLATQRAIADFLDAETARIDALVASKRLMVNLLERRRLSVVRLGVGGGFMATARRPTTLHWLDDLPSHWREGKLTLLARLGSGHTPSRSHPEWWVDCTIPWITTGEVAQMRTDRIEYIQETRERISTLGVANSSAEIHPAGTVVLSRTASAGYSAIMAEDMATSQDFVTWTCGPALRPRFLLLCLRAMREDLLGRLAMGSTHQTIYMPDVESIRIPVPDLPEQDRVVDETWRRMRPLATAIDRIDRQIELLREHRQALITAAVTGELSVP